MADQFLGWADNVEWTVVNVARAIIADQAVAYIGHCACGDIVIGRTSSSRQCSGCGSAISMAPYVESGGFIVPVEVQ